MLKKSFNVKVQIESVKDFFQIKGAECPLLGRFFEQKEVICGKSKMT